MKAPESLETLVEYGIVQEVLRPLMSGKEAQVYVVLSAGTPCVAKVYKEATHRNFKHRADYTEGRRTRNTRDQRAINKRSAHGRKKDEDAWRSTEVDMIYRLRDAGVRVPEPLNFVEGVLVMELVLGADGEPAPRLGDLDYSPAEAQSIYDRLMRDVVKMLCAGVVHGDLSDFNVLMSADGPVIIDFPQSVDPTQNPNSEKLFLRDVANLHRFLARFAPEAPIRPYGEEIWKLFQTNKLKPDTELKGNYRAPRGKVDTSEVMALIDDAQRDADRRDGRDSRGGEGDVLDGVVPPSVGGGGGAGSTPPLRRVVDFTQERKAAARKSRPERGRKSGQEKSRPARGRGRAASASDAADAEGEKRAPRGPRGAARPARGDRSASSAGERSEQQDAGASPGRARSRGRRRGNRSRAHPPSGPASTREGDANKDGARDGRRRSSEGRASDSSGQQVQQEGRPTTFAGASEPKPGPRKRSRRRRGGNAKAAKSESRAESKREPSGKPAEKGTAKAKPAARDGEKRSPRARRRRPRRAGPSS